MIIKLLAEQYPENENRNYYIALWNDLIVYMPRMFLYDLFNYQLT
jgi:hypothetical protein